jgi:hypothetical protein
MTVGMHSGKRRDRVDRQPTVLAVALVLACASSGAVAQDLTILQSVEVIERTLGEDPFEIVHAVGNRFEGDRTQRVVIRPADDSLVKVKWAQFARGGEAFNNQPRHELAAYRLQKLFLDEPELVVPPTVARAFDLEWYREHDPDAGPTFDGTSSVLAVLQYWLWNVETLESLDRGRFRTDPAYARSVANLNLFTYLARHGDSNRGNFMISREPADLRVFAVDNGFTFGPEVGDQGHEWRSLRVERVPRTTVDRLRGIDLADLEAALAVVAQFQVEEGRLVTVEPTDSLDPKRGIRRNGGVVQLGLTSAEIRGVLSRLTKLVERVDRGKIATF